MGFPRGGSGGGGVSSVDGLTGAVSLAGLYYATKNGGPEPYGQANLGNAATFTPDLTTFNRWEVTVAGAAPHTVAMPSTAAMNALPSGVKKWYLHIVNDGSGNHGDLTFSAPAGGTLTFIGIKHSFNQTAGNGDDYMFETIDNINWRGWHMTAETVHVDTVAPTLPITGQLWADVTGL